MLYEVKLSKAKNPSKKLRIVIYLSTGQKLKSIEIGDKKFEDYTIHKDVNRLNSYIKRHKKRENWTSSGLLSRGFWSRYLLWNLPTLEESKKYIENNFNIKFI